MGSDTVPQCLFIAALVLFGGFFAGSETAFSNCNRVRIKSQAEDGDKGAKRVESILTHFDNALVTLLIGNNVIHVLATSTATVLAIRWFGAYGSLISTVVMTLLIFVFSEMIPKNIAKANSEQFARLSAGVLRVLMVLLTPVAFCFTLLSNGLKKIFPKNSSEQGMTEDDFRSMIESIEDEGVMEAEESELIQAALKFSDTTVYKVMVPRIRIIGIDRHDGTEVCSQQILNSDFSRIPIYAGDLDHIVGIVNTKTYMIGYLSTGAQDMEKAISKPCFLRWDTDLYTAFQSMRQSKQHMAIVQDEWGGTFGLVTMTDLLDALMGGAWNGVEALV